MKIEIETIEDVTHILYDDALDIWNNFSYDEQLLIFDWFEEYDITYEKFVEWILYYSKDEIEEARHENEALDEG